MNTNSADKTKLLQQAAKKIKCLHKNSQDDSPLQDGVVTSSNPFILATELFGNILLETLNGFLFVVNNHGKVASVTDNVGQFLGYSPSQWADESIYNFLDVADHALFSQALLPLSGDRRSKASLNRSHVFTCRMRHCNKDGDTFLGDTLVERARNFVSMQVSCLPEHIPTDTAPNGSELYLVCVAQRMIDTAPSYSQSLRRQLSLPDQQQPHDMLLSAAEHLTTKVDKEYKILAYDDSCIGIKQLNQQNVLGQHLTNFVHSNDVPLFQRHMLEVTKGGLGCQEYNSSIYRFKLGDKRVVFIQSRSQLFTEADGSEVILSKHSIVRECDSTELKGSASTSLMKSIIGPTLTSQNSGNSLPPTGYMPNSPYNTGYPTGVTGPAPIRTHRNSNSLNMALMSGMQGGPLPDVNFNDMPGNVGNWTDMYDGRSTNQWPSRSNANPHNNMRSRHGSGFNNTSSPPMMGGYIGGGMQQNNMASSMTSMFDPNRMSQPNNGMGRRPTNPIENSASSGSTVMLRQLLSTEEISTSSPGNSSVQPAVTTSSSNIPKDIVLRTLLASDDEDELPAPLSLCRPIKSDGASPSSTSTPSQNSTEPVLLKKLLNEDTQDTFERTPKILPKLMKDEEKEPRASPLKSPATPGSNSSRRHNSGSSIKDTAQNKDLNKLSKIGEKDIEEKGRGTKRKASTSTHEADSSTAHNTHILSQLLTKSINPSSKPDSNTVTSTPIERRRAQRNHNGTDSIVDVVNERIIHGRDFINMENFSRLNSNSSVGYIQRQNSHSADTMYQRGLSRMDSDPMSSTSVNPCAKDYNSMMDPIQDINPSNFMPPNSRASNLDINSPTDSSMLQQLLGNDNGNLFQELESLLGSTDPNQMELTSPEDEIAIKDIEKQLLNSVESFPNYMGSESHSRSMSPNSYTMNVLSNLPAYASNPLHSTAIYNISHRPAISRSQSLGSYSPTSSGPSPSQQRPMMQGMSNPRPMSLGSMHGRSRIMSQGSGPPMGSPMDVGIRMRRNSGNYGPPMSPLQGGYAPLPDNFGELMKSTHPPPNIKLPADMSASGFPPSEMLPPEITSPRNRGQPSFSKSPMDIPDANQFSFPSDHMTQYSQGNNHGRPMLRMQSSAPHSTYQDDHYSSGMHPSQGMNHPMHSQMSSMRSGPQLDSGHAPMSRQNSFPQSSQPYTNSGSVDSMSSNGGSGSSQYVRQEIRAKCTARAQQNIPPQPSQYQTTISPGQNHMPPSSISSPPTSDSNPNNQSPMDSLSQELPEDIFEQISELTSEQLSRGQQKEQMKMSHLREQEIARSTIEKNQLETRTVREQLRALAGYASKDVIPLDSLFRTQLLQPPLKKTANIKPAGKARSKSGSTLHMEVEKLKQIPQSSAISIISTDERAPVEAIHPADQTGSLLQQLLTER